MNVIKSLFYVLFEICVLNICTAKMFLFLNRTLCNSVQILMEFASSATLAYIQPTTTA